MSNVIADDVKSFELFLAFHYDVHQIPFPLYVIGIFSSWSIAQAQALVPVFLIFMAFHNCVREFVYPIFVVRDFSSCATLLPSPGTIFGVFLEGAYLTTMCASSVSRFTVKIFSPSVSLSLFANLGCLQAFVLLPCVNFFPVPPKAIFFRVSLLRLVPS